VRFGINGKLSPRYIGPFPVVTQVENFAYRLDLPNSMNGMHNVLHGFMLRKYLRDPENHFTLEPKTIEQDLTFKPSYENSRGI